MKSIIFMFLLFSTNLKSEESNMIVNAKNNKKKTKVIIIDYVNSVWVNPINRAFQSYLDKTNENLSFYHFIWSNRRDKIEFLDEIVSWKPDIVFMPDEILYRLFAKEISIRTGAHLSTFFCTSTRADIIDYQNQSGVFNEYPAKKVIEFARKSFKIDRVAILGGPFAGDVVDKIQAPLKGVVQVDGFIETEWLKYKERLLEIEKKYDAVWLLLPFGVKDGEHVVDFKKLDLVAKQLKIPSFGYGGIDTVTRTITLGLLQEKVGQYCATLVYSAFFKGNKPEIQNYTSYDLSIDTAHALKLGLKITDEMAQFLKE